MALHRCKFGQHDASTTRLDDSVLDLNGNTVPDSAVYWLVTGKEFVPEVPGQVYGPGQFTGGSEPTKRYLVTGYITPPETGVTDF